jgi:hypothetical protein
MIRFSALSGVSAMVETGPLNQAPAAYAQSVWKSRRARGRAELSVIN